MKKKEWIETLLKAIEIKFNRGSSSEWRSKDFEDLSMEILKSTQVLISVSTLKRIFGQAKTDNEYYPYQTTIDVLVKYSETNIIEQKTNEDFNYYSKETKNEEAAKILNADTNLTSSFPNNKFKKNHAYLIALILIVGFTLFYVYRNLKTEAIPKVKLKVINIDGEKSCATALFSFNINELKDSIFFSDGLNPDQFLDPNSKSLSVFFNRPGKYLCTLKTKKSIISDTATVIVYSNSWESSLEYYLIQSRGRYVYLKKENIVDQGSLHINKQILKDLKIDLDSSFALNFDNYSKTDIDGDNFEFETQLYVKNLRKDVKCESCKIKIEGEKRSIIIKICAEGCGRFVNATISELQFYGVKEDLSALSIELNEMKKIEFINQNKVLNIKVGSKKVFQQKYQKTLGKIVGVSISFIGDGYINSLKLKDKNKAAIAF